MARRRRKVQWGELWRTLKISLLFTLPSAFLFARSVQSYLLISAAFSLPMAVNVFLAGQFVLADAKRWPLLKAVVVTALTFLTVAAVSLSIGLYAAISVASGKALLDPGVGRAFLQSVQTPFILVGFAIALLAMPLVSFLGAVSRKMGPGVLRSWLLGRYHHPRQEERVFLFLDLKGSTTLAEQLGDLKFSALIRDFFSDLAEPIAESHGEVSHYIGDEAVISFRPERALSKADCILCHFRCKAALRAEAAHYLEEYGVLPDFKSGLHMGQVVTTEVGVNKSEIVFHGDVLNTASRIQGKCSELGTDLLISHTVMEKATLPPSLTAHPFGTHELKGKQERVELWTVSQSEGNEAEVK